MNIYGVGQTTYGEPGLIISLTVEDARPLKLMSLIGWGDTSAEFEVFLNEEPVGGARSSTDTRTVQVWWDGNIVCQPFDVLEILATHYSIGLRTLKANLLLQRI